MRTVGHITWPCRAGRVPGLPASAGMASVTVDSGGSAMARAAGRGTTPSVDAAIRDMYGSLSEDLCFEHTLHRLGAIFRSNLSAMNTEDFGQGRSSVSGVGDISVDEYLALIEAYSGRFQGQNIWLGRSLPDLLQRGFQHGDAVVDVRELRQTEYYRHLLRPLDIRYGMGILLWSGGNADVMVASFHRGHGETSFDDDDMAIAAHVRPHLQNAYAIYRRIAQLEGRVESLRAGFQHAALGICVMDAAGAVLEINACAEAMLLGGRLAVLARDRSLHFASARARSEVGAALQGVARPDAPPATLVVGDAQGQTQRLVLHLCRVPGGVMSGFARRAALLLFVSELRPGHEAAWSEAVVQASLGFSRAEARVGLALLRHGDVPAVAAALGVSQNTVRSHVKTIHARLRIKRSSELLLILDRLLGTRPPG